MTDFDYETATYVIRNQNGEQRGPFNGKAATKKAAWDWQSECGDPIEVNVAENDVIVAVLWDDGTWMFPDLHDDEGNRLPERREW